MNLGESSRTAELSKPSARINYAQTAESATIIFYWQTGKPSHRLPGLFKAPA
jgi:hypothetical protein